jgi:hypothetical protein
MIYISQTIIEQSYLDFVFNCFNNSTLDEWHGTNILRVKDGKERLNNEGQWEYYQTPTHILQKDFQAIVALAESVKSAVAHDPNYQYIHYIDITEYPQGVSKPFHFDVARYTTTASSITYLNDDFIGGQTVIDGISVQPLTGRTVFFDGKSNNHCVMDVIKGARYTLSMWYGSKPAEEL